MIDERTKYFRRLRRLRRAARRWSVFTGTLFGASAVLVPYNGLGWPDAVWTALTGGTAALTVWRWRDLRELAALPPPAPVPGLARTPLEALVAKLPAGRTALAELRRMEARSRIRGSSLLPAWTRLDRAAQTFAGLSGRLGGSAADVVGEATAAERTLREIGERAAAVERALSVSRDDDALHRAHADLVGHFTQGVEAYEGLVGAAAGCVAQDGRVTDRGAVDRLSEATTLLRGIADGLSEMTTVTLQRTRPAQ